MKTFIALLYVIALVNFGIGVWCKNTYYVGVAIMDWLVAESLRKM